MRIVAIDPGVTTGIATWDSRRPYAPTLTQLRDDTHIALFNLLTSTSPDVVVIEKFLWQNRRAVVLTPVECIGVTKFYCASRGVRLVEQTPSQAKVLVTDEKLRALGWWSVGLNHARDAARHLAAYLLHTDEGKFLLERLKGEREQTRR